MGSHHKISEYIENLPLQKKLCKGYQPDDVYDVICTISSMYNQLLSDAYSEIEELRRQLEYLEYGKHKAFSQEVEIKISEQTPTSMADMLKEFVSVREIVEENVEESRGTDMTDKELQKLKRVELLEILLDQSKENEALKIQLESHEQTIQELNKKLEERTININSAGTIAEASFRLNGVFEAAEKAAQQYLDNLQGLYERENVLIVQKEAEAENRCKALLHATQERCDFMKEEIIQKCENMEMSVRQQCEELLEATELKCREREKEAEEKCLSLDRKAKDDVEKRWDSLSKRLEDFYSAHEGLKELLASSKMI